MNGDHLAASEVNTLRFCPDLRIFCYQVGTLVVKHLHSFRQFTVLYTIGLLSWVEVFLYLYCLFTVILPLLLHHNDIYSRSQNVDWTLTLLKQLWSCERTGEEFPLSTAVPRYLRSVKRLFFCFIVIRYDIINFHLIPLIIHVYFLWPHFPFPSASTDPDIVNEGFSSLPTNSE